MLAKRSNVSPFAARNRRRLSPTPAVLLTSSKADLLLDRSRSRAGSASPALQPIAHSAESARRDIVLVENISSAGIYGNGQENIGRNGKNFHIFGHLFSIPAFCRFPHQMPNFATLISISKHDRLRASALVAAIS
jgi:hypothetical protein